MCRRIAACLSLLAFAACLIVGAAAGNSFSTAVGRALLAMAGTFVIGLIVGAMGEKMIDENVRGEEEKLRNPASDDR